jgi:hypothetical protein
VHIIRAGAAATTVKDEHALRPPPSAGETLGDGRGRSTCRRQQGCGMPLPMWVGTGSVSL